jgi:hypothetical protein
MLEAIWVARGINTYPVSRIIKIRSDRAVSRNQLIRMESPRFGCSAYDLAIESTEVKRVNTLNEAGAEFSIRGQRLTNAKY